jgi:hypothetical protein
MDKIRFHCHGYSAPAYNCSNPGDCSGDYYKSTDVDKMQSQLRELVKEWREESSVTNVSDHDTVKGRKHGIIVCAGELERILDNGSDS